MKKMRNRRKNRTEYRKSKETILGVLFILYLFFVLILNVFHADRTVSERENRALQQRPNLTWNSLTTGSFMNKYEEYISDQFAGRDGWKAIETIFSRVGGSRLENGVFLGKNNQLMEDIYTPNTEEVKANIHAIKEFSKSYDNVSVSMMLVPDAATVLKKELPFLASVADQNRMIASVKKELGEDVQWIDVSDVMNQHLEEDIYYKTDQHWTSLGAFYAFGAAAETLGIASDASKQFASYPVSTSFNGALAAKSGCELNVKEEIDIYVPKETDLDLVVNYVDEERKTTSLYDSSKLTSGNQYEVFLGGNFSVMDIRTSASRNQRLLLVKDSFANNFIQFLAPYYREIVVVDPRYYGGTINEIMETYRITDVLFLYRGNTFFSDNNISGVFESE